MDQLFHYKAEQTKHLVRVDVTGEKISFLAVNAAAWVFEADIKDVVGCHLMKNASLNDPYLRIFYYPFDDRRTKRKKIIVDLKPAGDNAFDDCLKTKLMILRASCCFPRDLTDDDTLKSIENLQKLLILVNPKSGKGTARKTFTSKVVPILNEANIGCDAVFTTGPNHARRLVKTVDLTIYRGIVVVSGDGLLFEVINGLLEREDWETAIQVSLGIIPQGSGNGIARTLADAQNEPYHSDPVLTSALNIIRARPKEVDLMRVVQRFPDESEKTYYAVLSVGYGLLADIDIESERLRSLGESRFTIWAVLRLIGLKTYQLKISYLQAEPGDKNGTQPQKLSPRLLRSTTEVKKPRNDELMRRTISADANITVDSLEPFVDARIEYGDIAEEAFVPADTFGPSSKYPPLTGEIPSDWITIEGEFVLVYAVMQRFIGTDNMFAPKSKMNDGLIYLLLIRGGTSRAQLFQFLTSFESGTHVDVPCCEMIPVKAFRLEPATCEGNLTIDGEKVPTAPVQVEILPSFYRVFMR